MSRKPRFINLGVGREDWSVWGDTATTLGVLIAVVLVASTQTAAVTAVAVALGLFALGWSRHVLFYGREPSSWTVTAEGVTARYYGLRRVQHRWANILGVKEEAGEHNLVTTRGEVPFGRNLLNAALLARVLRERLGQTQGDAEPCVALAVARDVVEQWLGVTEGGRARILDWQLLLLLPMVPVVGAILASSQRGDPRPFLVGLLALAGLHIWQWPLNRAGGRYVLWMRADSDGLHAMTTSGRVRIGWNSLVALRKYWGARTLLRGRDGDLVFSGYSGLGTVLTAIQHAIELNRAGHSLPRMTDADVPASGLSRASAAATAADRGVSRTDP